jgi:hypothetical protein
MKTIEFKMEQVTNHTVTIEIPVYFKVETTGGSQYYRIYEDNSGSIVMDRIVRFALDNTFDILTSHKFDPKILDLSLSDENEFVNILIEARDFLDNKIDSMAGYVKETEEDEPLTEEEIAEMRMVDAADVRNDELKYQEFEKQNFAALIKD